MSRTPSATSTRHSTRPAAIVLLVIGAWMPVGWAVLQYGDITYAPVLDALVGVALLALGFVALRDRQPRRGLWTLAAGVGFTMFVLPIVFRYGYGDSDRNNLAYLNNMVLGVVVIVTSVWASHRSPRV